MHDPHPFIGRVWRALLRLLPFEFRAEFGRDIEQAIADEHDDVRARRSVAETLRFCARTTRDLLRTAPRQHWDVFRQDLRVGVRLLGRNPGFSATAILTLALGIGGSTAIFSVVHAVVFRPLDFPASERVVRVGWRTGVSDRHSSGSRPIAFSNLLAIRAGCTSFDEIGATQADNLSSDAGELRVRVQQETAVGGVGESFFVPQMASASVFRIFGASVVLGRLPGDADERPGAPPVAVISDSTWTRLYGRDPGVLGRTVTRHLGDGRSVPVAIIGVLAPDAFAAYSSQTPAWAALDPQTLSARDDKGRELFRLQTLGRLRPGVSIERAQAELAAVTPSLVFGLPDHIASPKSSLGAVRLRDLLAARVRTPLLAFFGAVCCLLLVAIVNVASVVLARTISRGQEFAARFALGARPLRVARQLLTESALLAVIGGALGLALAWWGVRAFVAASPAMPRLNESAVGAPALIFALIGVLVATCTAGLIPVLLASRRSVADGLRRAGGAAGGATVFSRPLAVLAAAEIALVLVLLAGTGLLVHSFGRLVLFDLGFDPQSLVMASIEHPSVPPAPSRPVPQGSVPDMVAVLSDRQRVLAAVDGEVLQRMSTIPGVAAAGLTGDDPFGPPYRYALDLDINDVTHPSAAALRIANPTALQALGMQVRSGRWFTEADREGSPLVVVVNETMAGRFWNGRSPIGDRIAFSRRSLQVVGVVGDVRGERGARADASATFYVSSAQLPPDPAMLAIRTRPGFTDVEQAISTQLSQMGNRISAGTPRRLEDLFWRRLSETRFLTLTLSTFTLLTLVVALVGVHGVLRFLVVQRTREMGIRKALGATPFQLVTLVAGHALRFAVPGCVLGLAGAAVVGPTLRTLLFGITPTDPLTLAAVTLLLIGAVLAAAYLPARRASAVDPSLLLRSE